MNGRLLRVTGTVLVIAVAFVTPVLATSTPAAADTVVDGCTIVAKPTAANFTNCPGVNLESADLSGVNLTDANFAGADLSLSSLSGADLSNANLSSAGLAGADLSSANLTSANLTDASLAFCFGFGGLRPVVCFSSALDHAVVTNANFTDARLAACASFTVPPPLPPFTFYGCGAAGLTGLDLSGVNLTGATLGACLGGSCADVDVTGTLLVPSGQTAIAPNGVDAVVTWPSAQALPGATPGACAPPSGSTFPLGPTTVTCEVLDDLGNIATGLFAVTVLRQISQVSIPCTKLAGCNLSGIDLSYVVLAKADLHGANLTNANLSGANLNKADLHEANLTNANLSGANLTKADLQGAKVNQVNWGIDTICPDGTNVDSPPDGESCIGHLLPR
jgi:uncharacterized protein YjbI with pentapeptide repeats